jgi:Xaa-Pro dipeptidase
MFDPLRDAMAAHGLDAAAIVPGANFRLLLKRDFHLMERPLLLIIPREGKSAAIVPELEMASFGPLGFEGHIFPWRDEEGYRGAFAKAAQALPQLARATKFGLEAERMRAFEMMALQQAFPGARFVNAHQPISEIRLRKTADEIAYLRRAIEISEAALEATLAQVRIGLTEKQIERVLINEMFNHGAGGLAFDPIVAAGDNSAQPHAVSRETYQLKAGDALLIDFGASWQGYNADITRTFFVGGVSDRDRRFYETVAAANAAGKQAVRAGVTAHAVDDVVQKVLEGSEFAQFRQHKTGHGLGLDVHEAPQIMRGNQAVLEPGIVFTVEPGLYRPNEVGVRIEDDVVVTDTGHQCLTSFPRELRIVG